MKHKILLLLSLLFVVGVISAGDVYLNGVKVEGSLKGQTIKQCDVEFKNNGDFYITAKNYQIEKKATKATQKKGPYYIIFTTTSGKVTVPITVFLDGKQVSKQIPDGKQIYIEIGDITMGQHQIRVIAPRDVTIPSCSVAIGLARKVKDTMEISVESEKAGNFGTQGLDIAHLFKVEY